MSSITTYSNTSSCPINLGDSYPYSLNRSSPNGNSSLIHNSRNHTYTMIPKSPSYVFGEYVVGPLIQRIEGCFAHFSVWIKSIDSFMQLPVAAAAKIPQHQLNLLKRLASEMSDHSELSGAAAELQKLTGTANAEGLGRETFSETVFQLMMGIVSLATEPAVYITEKFIEGIRQKQFSLAVEELKQLKAQAHRYRNELNKFNEDRETRTQIRQLENQKKGIQAQIDQLNTDINAKTNTLRGVQNEIKPKLEKIKGLKQSLRTTLDSLEHTKKFYQKNHQYYSIAVIKAAINSKHQDLQNIMDQIDPAMESITRLRNYRTNTYAAQVKLVNQRDALINNNRKNLDSQIAALKSRLRDDL